MNYATQRASAALSPHKPRLGFVGLGWIGRNRMESVVDADVAEVCGVHDVTPAAAREAGKLVPGAVLFSSFAELLQHDLDGLVIATPNCFHAEQGSQSFVRSRSDETRAKRDGLLQPRKTRTACWELIFLIATFRRCRW
jgi:hypothetical protein